MPYIKPNLRERCTPEHYYHETEGELNYGLTCLVLEYVLNHNDDYATYNAILGALEGCKAEFYRRVIAPYEDKKRADNGDVYVE